MVPLNYLIAFHDKSMNEQLAALKDTLRMRKINQATRKIKFIENAVNLKFDVLIQTTILFEPIAQ